jgi:SAM-dependent methyltransferase
VPKAPAQRALHFVRMALAGTARLLVPHRALERLRELRRHRLWRRNATRPVKEVFREIYARNLWGGAPGELCSGSGSAEELAIPYAEVIGRFVESHGLRTIVDLGCGDFSVGRLIASKRVRYIGIDVVDEVVRRNRDRHGAEGVEFVCLDITRDELPPGDLCLVRQVLQHLSNAEILVVLERTRGYPFIIVTEHLPPVDGVSRPNLDKPHGADTRLPEDSGVFLEEEPFRQRIVEILLDVPVREPLRRPGEHILTFRIR